jgi:hypothetical protein
MSSGSKKKEPRCLCLSEAKASLKHKILIISGSRKEPRYTLFSLRSPGKWTPSRFPHRTPIDREARSHGTLHLSKTYLTGSPVKELPPPSRPPPRSLLRRDAPSPEPLHLALNVRGRRALFQVPQTEPLWKEMPVSRALSTYLSGSPARKPQHRDCTYKTVQTVYAATKKQLPRFVIIKFESPQSFIECSISSTINIFIYWFYWVL